MNVIGREGSSRLGSAQRRGIGIRRRARPVGEALLPVLSAAWTTVKGMADVDYARRDEGKLGTLVAGEGSAPRGAVHGSAGADLLSPRP